MMAEKSPPLESTPEECVAIGTETETDENPTIVIDCGSEMCTAGFAGDDVPKSLFPTIVGSSQLVSKIFDRR